MTMPVAMEFGLDAASQVDAIEEIRLRTWARQNYVPGDERDATWHPVIQDEMQRVDEESD